MDNMEAGCIFHVKVSAFTYLEQSKTSLLTVNKSGIFRLTIPMTGLVASVSCISPGMLGDKHQPTSFPSKNGLFFADNHAILAVLYRNLSLQTNKLQRTDIVHILVLWETLATCTHVHQESS
jgi:hypothetical protein